MVPKSGAKYSTVREDVVKAEALCIDNCRCSNGNSAAYPVSFIHHQISAIGSPVMQDSYTDF